MTRHFLFSMIAAFILCFFVSPAWALMFSDLNWAGYSNDRNAVTFSDSDTGLGYDIGFASFGGDITWNPNDGGIGIGDDEITGSRNALLMWFSKPVHIATFELVDLFYEGYSEKGFYLYDSDLGDGLSLYGAGIFQASLDQWIGGEGPDAGSYSIGIDDQVQGVVFSAIGSRNDYALAGYTTPVPEPSTMLLLGLGMLGLAGIGRKRFMR